MPVGLGRGAPQDQGGLRASDLMRLSEGPDQASGGPGCPGGGGIRSGQPPRGLRRGRDEDAAAVRAHQRVRIKVPPFVHGPSCLMNAML